MLFSYDRLAASVGNERNTKICYLVDKGKISTVKR